MYFVSQDRLEIQFQNAGERNGMGKRGRSVRGVNNDVVGTFP